MSRGIWNALTAIQWYNSAHNTYFFLEISWSSLCHLYNILTLLERVPSGTVDDGCGLGAFGKAEGESEELRVGPVVKLVPLAKLQSRTCWRLWCSFYKWYHRWSIASWIWSRRRSWRWLRIPACDCFLVGWLINFSASAKDFYIKIQG
jgi:hypothetical protein